MGRAPPRSGLDRRQALALLARSGALLVAGCGTTSGESPGCFLSPPLTAGPYWRDDALRRSDLRWDSQPSSGQEPLPGVALELTIHVSTTSEGRCRALRGAQVDLWQCDAQGVYSGVPESGTAGRDFLRGFQLTDDSGGVRFLTVIRAGTRGAPFTSTQRSGRSIPSEQSSPSSIPSSSSTTP